MAMFTMKMNSAMKPAGSRTRHSRRTGLWCAARITYVLLPSRGALGGKGAGEGAARTNLAAPCRRAAGKRRGRATRGTRR